MSIPVKENPVMKTRDAAGTVRADSLSMSIPRVIEEEDFSG
jgi:hypothetical protein